MPNESRAAMLLNRLAVGMRRVTAELDEVGSLAILPVLIVGFPLVFYGRFVVITQAEMYIGVEEERDGNWR